MNGILSESMVDPIARIVLILVMLIVTWITQRVARILIVRVVEGLWQTAARIRHLDIQLETTLSEELTRPIQVLIVTLGLRLALLVLELSELVVSIINPLTATIVILALFWIPYRITDFIARYYVTKAAHASSPLDETIVRFGRQIAAFLIFVFASFLIFQEWGLDVGALIASLGVASLAVALAAQDVLSNIIAYFAILLDSPFKVGDFIIIDNLVKGKVQEISFRSTRIRTLENSVMVIPNQTIANANVINWARIRKRRLDILLGITYSSTPHQIESIIEDTRAMLDAHDQVTQDRKIVEFVEFDESSLNLRITFLVKVATWEDLETIKTDINFKLMHIIKQHGTSVAFPTRTVVLDAASQPKIESVSPTKVSE